MQRLSLYKTGGMGVFFSLEGSSAVGSRRAPRDRLRTIASGAAARARRTARSVRFRRRALVEEEDEEEEEEEAEEEEAGQESERRALFSFGRVSFEFARCRSALRSRVCRRKRRWAQKEAQLQAPVGISESYL